MFAFILSTGTELRGWSSQWRLQEINNGMRNIRDLGTEVPQWGRGSKLPPPPVGGLETEAEAYYAMYLGLSK